MTHFRRLRVIRRLAVRKLRHLFRTLALNHDVDEGFVVVLAAVIGALAGLTVIGFYEFLDWVRTLAGWARETSGGAGTPWLALPLVPAGLWAARRLLPDDPSGAEMVPALIRASVRHGGQLPVTAVLRKLLAAGVTIGAGGSLGAEGPVAAGGAAVGSGLSQALKFGPRRTRVLLACGTAGGIAAAFNAPIAGVLFALEVVLGTFAVGALSPVVVASVMGAVVSRRFLGASPAFEIPTEFHFGTAAELPLYLLLGLLSGVLAWAFVRLFYRTQDVLAAAVPHLGLRSVVAGLLIATLGLGHPELLGDGRHGIELILSSELAGLAVLGLGFAKIFSSGLTAGGGGAGGVFTPSLFVGAAFGSFFGLTVQRVFPALPVSPEAYALVGMAAIVAGATFAPLTAIIMIFEMTDDYGLILPLMLVCVVSYLIARRLSPESIYSEALARTGDRIVHGADRSALEHVRVSDCFDRDPDVVLEDAPVRSLLGQIRESRQSGFPVVTRDLEFSGMLNYQQVARALEEGLMDVVIAADLQVPEEESVTPQDTLLTAMRKMNLRDVDLLPVLQGPDSRRLIGLLSRADIMEAYQTRLLLEE
ncbi:MAG: chloride channel protein [Gemmatimonadota bacterium]